MINFFDLYKARDALRKSVEDGKLAKNTAECYYKFLKVMNKQLPSTKSEDIMNWIKENHKSGGEMYASAIRYYEVHVLKRPGAILYPSHRMQIRNTREATPLKKSVKAYNANISGSKYELEFRIMQYAGLRVSEVAALKRKDIMFKNGELYIHVRNGKGGKSRMVRVLPNRWLYKNIRNWQDCPDKDVEKYTERMQREADRNNFNCHALRKIYAQAMYWTLWKTDGYKKKEAIQMVADYLGHSSTYVTTHYYLMGEEKKNKRGEFYNTGKANGKGERNLYAKEVKDE